MADFVGIDIVGEEKIAKKLKKLPDEAGDQGVEAANKYIKDVVQLYPPKKYFSRASAYPNAPAGPGWFSDAQRRYVMARLSSGEISIPYGRTQTLRNGWRLLGYGTKQILVNEEPAAVYAHDDSKQAAQMKGAGWKKIGEILKERLQKIVKTFDGGVKRAIKKVKLE